MKSTSGRENDKYKGPEVSSWLPGLGSTGEAGVAGAEQQVEMRWGRGRLQGLVGLCEDVSTPCKMGPPGGF